MRKHVARAVALAPVFAASLAFAQDRATQFVAVTGPTREHVPGGALLVAAYGLVWLVLFGVVLRTAWVEAQAAKDLARLDAALSGRTAVPAREQRSGAVEQSGRAREENSGTEKDRSGTEVVRPGTEKEKAGTNDEGAAEKGT